MRLNLLLAATAAAAFCSGAAMAQTADVSHSSTPSTNDPTTHLDDQCGENKGPRPCGAQVVEVPIPAATESQTYVEPAPSEPVADTSTSQMYSTPAPAQPEVTTRLVTNGPVPDTPENRARFGGPDSNGGKRTAPVGNVP